MAGDARLEAQERVSRGIELRTDAPQQPRNYSTAEPRKERRWTPMGCGGQRPWDFLRCVGLKVRSTLGRKVKRFAKWIFLAWIQAAWHGRGPLSSSRGSRAIRVLVSRFCDYLHKTKLFASHSPQIDPTNPVPFFCFNFCQSCPATFRVKLL